ncbi:MAG TPA: EthD family reductase [Paucimonas sp.]|nr:EthD family reductase [Paucimonas sp.]
MIRVTKYYRWQDSASFDRRYYSREHMQLTREQLLPYGLLRLESDHRLSSRAPEEGEIIAASHAYFRSFEQAQAAMTAAGPTLMRDSARYTNLLPEIRFSAVTEHF